MIDSKASLLANRRSAVAVIFALALVPLVLLVGLTLDFTFYGQAKAEINLAADASATHAIRAATATYARETNAGVQNATAISDAVTAGQTAGYAAFQAQLGLLPTAYMATPTSGLTNPQVTVTPTSTNSEAGFTAAVSYVGVYPPFFGALFSNKSNWYVTGTSKASSAYSYVEVLLLLDTSGSMLIGARPSDILTMEDDSVCPLTGTVTYANKNSMSAYDGAVSPSGVSTKIDFTQVPNYNSGGVSTNTNGTCNSTHIGYIGNTSPFAPCAFACHTDTVNIGTNSKDFYGLARQEGVELRLDVVLNATENVISDMAAAEQAPDQFSVGVYEFNYDISPIVQGTSTDLSSEATDNLATAEQQVKAIDYTITPTETRLPHTVSVADDDTNFPLSITHLISGTFLNSSAPPTPLGYSGNGTTQATPEKDLFIVTDGMEDDGSDFPGGSAGRVSGPMTGVLAEKAYSLEAPGGVCARLKNPPYNFNIYVMYIYYYPLANNFYMTSTTTQTPYFTQDYGTGLKPTTADFAEATSMTNSSPQSGGLAPDVAALQACASNPGQFFQANSASDIGTAMSAMLASALSTTIRTTQ